MGSVWLVLFVIQRGYVRPERRAWSLIHPQRFELEATVVHYGYNSTILWAMRESFKRWNKNFNILADEFEANKFIDEISKENTYFSN